MKIALLTTEYLSEPGAGGIGTYVYHLARGLSVLGHSVHVVTISETVTESTVENGINVHRVGLCLPNGSQIQKFLPYTWWSVSRTLSLWSRLSELLEDVYFDIVDVADCLAEGLWNSLVLAIPMCVRLQTPAFLLSEMGLRKMEENFDSWLLSFLEHFSLRKADALIAASEYLAREIGKRCLLGVNEIKIIRNPIDRDLIPVKAEYGLTNGICTILYVGRLEKLKGIYCLLEAFREAVSVEPELRLKIIGADSIDRESGMSNRAVLEEMISKHQLGERVEFVESLPGKEVWEQYRKSDMVVIPSLYDNAPYTCVEAMCAGMPIVGTDNGGMPEYLGEQDRGLICSAGNPGELCRAILTLARDQKLREQLGLNARAFVDNNCEYLLVARQSLDVYENAIKSHSQSVSYRNCSNQVNLKRVIHTAFKMCELLEDYLEKYGPASMEISGYNKGYKSGLIDGEQAGVQKGKMDVIYSNVGITFLYRLQRLLQSK